MSDWRERIEAARRQAEAGDIQAATRILRGLVDSGNPLHGQHAAMTLGILLITAGDEARARAALRYAADGQDREVAARAGAALAGLGDSVAGERDEESAWAEEALAEGDEAVLRELVGSADADYGARAALALATLAIDRGDLDDARQSLEAAVAHGHPDHTAPAYRCLGGVLYDLGELDAAHAAYLRAAEDFRPEIRLGALISAGQMLAELGDADRARASYQRVIDTGHPNYAIQARGTLAELHQQVGDVEAAIATFGQVAGSGHPVLAGRAAYNMALLLDEQGRRREAMAALGRAAEDRDPQVAMQAKAAMLVMAHRAAAPPEPPEPPEPVAEVPGPADDARAACRRAIESGVDGEVGRAAIGLALLELSEGDTEAARAALVLAAERDEGAAGVEATVLRLLLDGPQGSGHPLLRAAVADDTDTALAAYEAATADPDPCTAGLARVFLGLEDGGDVELYRAAVEPDEPLPLAAGGYLLAAALRHQDGDGDGRAEARAVLERGVRRGHLALLPWLAVELGDACAADGLQAEAWRAYEQAMDADHARLAGRAFAALAAALPDDDPERRRGLLRRGAASRHAELARRASFLLARELVADGDLGAAAAAFDRAAEDPDLAAAAGFGAALIRRDLPAARAAFGALGGPEGPEGLDGDDSRLRLACDAGVQLAHHYQRQGDAEAAGCALELVSAAADPYQAQHASLFLGLLRKENGDPAGGLAALDRAAAGDDGQLAMAAAYSAACLRHEQGDRDAAADGYRRVMAGPDADLATEAAGRLGRLVVEQGDEEAARAVFASEEQAAGAGDPDSAAALRLGRTLRDLGENVRAAAALAEAAGGADPAIAGQAAFELGVLRHGTGDTEGAARAWRLAVDTGDPGVVGRAAHNLGQALAELGDVDGAGRAFRQAADSGDPAVLASATYRLGELLEEAGDPEGAQAAYAEAADLAGEHGEEDVARLALARLGEEDAAHRGLRLAGEGDLAGARAAWAEAYSSAGVADVCLAFYRQDLTGVRDALRGLPPGGPEHDTASEIVLTSVAGGDGVDATGLAFLEVVAEDGHPHKAAWALLTLASHASAEGDRVRAELLCRRIREGGVREVVGAAAHNLGRWREGWGDLDGAEEAYRWAMAGVHPRAAARARDALADLLEARGDVAGAREVLESAAGSADAAEAAQALVDLVRMCYERGDREALEDACLRAAGSPYPAAVEVGAMYLGMFARDDGDHAGAAAWFRRSAETGVSGLSLLARYDLGLALRDLGELDAARAELAPLAGCDDPEQAARGQILLGSIAADQGDLAAATDWFAAAVRSDGKPDSTQLALNNLVATAYQRREAGDHAGALATLAVLAGLDEAERAAGVARDLAEEGDGVGAGDLATRRAYLEYAAEHGDERVAAAARAGLFDLLHRDGGDPDETRAALERLAGGEGGGTEETEASLRSAAAGDDPRVATMATYVLGQTLRGRGDLEGAEEAYLRVVESGDPEYAPNAMLELGALAHAAEHVEAAAEWWRRAVDAGNEEAALRAATNLGGLGKHRRDLAEAEPWYRQVVESGHPESAALAAAHLGELCYWLGDADAATGWYRRALAATADPGLVAEAAYRVGEASWAAGDTGAATPPLEGAAGTGDPVFAPFAADLLGRPTPATTGEADIPRHLRAATDLLPPDLVERAGEAEELRLCESLSYHHLWMNTLARVGRLAEDDEGLRLPPAYWLHLKAAAAAMDFPEFLPYFHGRSRRLPPRDHYDMAAALVTLHARLGEGWRRRYPELFGQLDRFVRVVGVLDGAEPTGDDPELAGRLRERKLLTRAVKRQPALSELVPGLFDDLFALVREPDLPAELSEEAWAVVCPNWFEVRIGEGLLSLSYATVWWRE
ncbi:MAG: tetratricopeptide repeat protein [Mycobacteriales bacterium]